MDFFGIQERSHRNTRLAIVLFACAVLVIIAAISFCVLMIDYNVASYPDTVGMPPLDWALGRLPQIALVSGLVLLLILIGSFYKINLLRGGGAYVARSLGGVAVDPDTKDLDERKLQNIVAEMSIASGVPQPEVFVLPDEQGINAFAAGFTPASAAIGVTRGCIEKLDRDQLQGVIAHEFSHILNGDMALNIRLMGVLHGILLIALTGQGLFRSLSLRTHRSRRGSQANGLLAGAYATGLVMMLVGYIGVFFARLIQAIVSRQREYLADASAVQFTRNPDGIAGALMVISGLRQGSRIRAPEAQEVSHMLFGAHRTAFSDLFATHPPVLKRIQAIKPTFDPEAVDPQQVAAATAASLAGAAAFAGGGGGAVSGETVAVEEIVDTVGHPTGAHLAYAQQLYQSLPEVVTDALTTIEGAEAVVLAVSVHPSGDVRKEQIEAMRSEVPVDRIRHAATIHNAILPLGRQVRLPLLDLALPVLHAAGPERMRALCDLVHELAWADGALSPFEFALVSAIRTHFRDAFEHVARVGGRASLPSRRQDLQGVFAVLAHASGGGADAVESAYVAGMMELFGSSWPELPAEPPSIPELESALDGLDRLAPRAKRQLVAALARTAAHDGTVALTEYELLRAICETIHCPLPPMIHESLQPAG